MTSPWPLAAMLLFSTLVTHLFMFVALDGFDQSMLSAQVKRQVEIVFHGLAGNHVNQT